MSFVKMPLAEAAASLGISVDALRKRLQRGAFETEKDYRGHIIVHLPEDKTRQAKDGQSEAREVEALRKEVAFLRAHTERLALLLEQALKPR